MTKKEWDMCFGPAPDAFSAAVEHALKTKEEKPMKRMIPRAAAVALALCIALTGVALAAGSGILDFLQVKNSGEVQVVQPRFVAHYEESAQPLRIEVTEAVCDGIAAHVLVTYTSDTAALAIGGEENRQDLPFAQERAASGRIIGINPILESLETGGGEYFCWDHRFWRYEAANKVTMDVSISLQDIPVDGVLTLKMNTWLEEKGETIAELPFDLEITPQQANRKTFAAENVPISMENSKINEARVIRTDLACYVMLEVEDDYDPAAYEASFVETENGEESTMKLPLHASWWFDVLDEKGNAMPRLQGFWRNLESENGEEWEHMIVTVSVPAFEVGDTLTVRPYDSGTWEEYPAVTLTIKPQ